MTHISVGNLTIIGSDNGLSPGRRQAIIWTNDGILLIGPLGTNFSEILINIITFSFKKMLSKVSSGKRRPSCLGLNVLNKPNPIHLKQHVYHDYLRSEPVREDVTCVTHYFIGEDFVQGILSISIFDLCNITVIAPWIAIYCMETAIGTPFSNMDWIKSHAQ